MCDKEVKWMRLMVLMTPTVWPLIVSMQSASCLARQVATINMKIKILPSDVISKVSPFDSDMPNVRSNLNQQGAPQLMLLSVWLLDCLRAKAVLL